jgi:hypothetical protein
MDKIKTVDIFCNSLKDLGIDFARKSPYHVQVEKIHNFYPTSRTYHNTTNVMAISYHDNILFNKEAFKQFLTTNTL